LAAIDEYANIFSVCFFMLFLLSHEIKTEQRQTLILFCEVHFSILYILQLDLISKALENCGPIATEVLSQLGWYLLSLPFLFLC
jgi:piezo-type mechanosensitive ion channel component 1/2